MATNKFPKITRAETPQEVIAQRPTYDALSHDTRLVAHALALLWSWCTVTNVHALLRELQWRNDAGKPATQDQVRYALASLRQTGWAVERDGRPGHWQLSDPFRAHMYGALLESYPLAELRQALHRSLGMPPANYYFHWPLYETATSAAVFRLELFLGDEPSAMRMREQISQRLSWGAVYGEACFDGFDPVLAERLTPTWRWAIARDAVHTVSTQWHVRHLPVARWALAQSGTRLVEMPIDLRHHLAHWQLQAGQRDEVLRLLAGDSSGEAEALRAALMIQAGRWEEGATAFAAALKLRQQEVGAKKRVFFPSLACYYPLALMAQQNAKANALARKFCVGESGKSAPPSDEGWGLWAHALGIRLGETPVMTNSLIFDGEDEAHPYRDTFWRLLLRSWLAAELPLRQDPIAQHSYDEVVRSLRQSLRECGLYWLEQQVAAADALLTGRVQAAVAGDSSTPPPFFAGSPVETWRGVLDALRALGEESAPTSATAGETQLLWALTLGKGGTVDDIAPLERKRGQRGWGSAKPVGLGKVSGMSHLPPHDARVARTIRADRHDKRSFTMDRAAAIMALVGHPQVVLAGAIDLPVDLVESAPQLETVREKTAEGERFILRVSPAPHPPNHDKAWMYSYDPALQKEVEALRYITVLQDSPQRLRVISLSPAQRRAAMLVSNRFSVPVSAQSDLQEALRVLSGHFSVHSDEAAAAARQVPAETRLRAELAPAGDGLLLRLVAMPLGEQGPRLMPGHGRVRLMAAINGEQVGTERDLPAEQAHLDAVLARLEFLDPPMASDTLCEWTVDDPELALSMVEQLPALPAIAAVDWPRGKAVRVTTLEAGNVQLRVKSERDWFRLDGGATLDEGRVLNLEALLAAAAGSSRFVALGEGAYLALSKSLREKLQALAAVAEADKHGLRAPPLAAGWLDEALEGLATEFDATFSARIDSLRRGQEENFVVPKGLQAELRSYQEDGYAWAMRLAQAGFGACLADDMGLGKTLQALAVLVARAPDGPALVVAPTSVCGNWQAEAGRFAPGLKVSIFGEDGRDELIASAAAGDILIVSYTLMQQAGEAFAGRTWHTLVADEAQAVKNALAKRSQALFDIPADFRLALSGTPVENRLAELWSIMRFCNAGLLGTLSRFNERFAAPIERHRDREAQRLLRRLIAPFVLRRTKTQVLDDLPPRTEMVFTVTPDADEAAHYEALRRHAISTAESIAKAAGGQEGQTRLHILAQLTKLRRAACDPRLTTPDLGYVGAKVRAFAELAAELTANGHKTLVFSQFVDFLTLLRAPLDEAGIAYQYLDGSTPPAQRTARVAAFQAGEGDLFLISLKAGGFGLNLTAADYVVITDPWWNPAAEDQAMGRAHRIGQQRPVTVYRLVSKGTLEERIIELHHDKRALAEGVLAEGGESASLPSTGELIDLMRG